MRIFFILFIAVYVLTACGTDRSYEPHFDNASTAKVAYKGKAAVAETGGEAEPMANADTPAPERKIIRTVNTRFQVEDLKASTKRIESLTQTYGGMISNMNQKNSNYQINNQLTIRIPAEKLDALLADLEKEAVFTDYTRVSAEDVTEEFLDLDTRLSTKKEVRDRYVAILRDKAKTVKDVLEAEEKIRVIQEEIESVEGRMKYLQNKSALSTVIIEIYQKVEYVAKPDVYEKSFFARAAEGFLTGWELIQNIMIGLISIWPLLLLLLLTLFLSRRYVLNNGKPLKRKKVENKTSSSS